MSECEGMGGAADERKERLSKWVAITVALVSVFMGITKIKDDNIVQAMVQHKSDAVDTWNEYQAKKLKHHMAELGLSQLQALQLLIPKTSAADLNAQRKQFQEQITRYQGEEAAIMKRAKDHEKAYDDLNTRDDQFDLSDACLSVCLAIVAVSSLANNWWLLYLSWGFASAGIFMGGCGLLGYSVHPDFLIRMLT